MAALSELNANFSSINAAAISPEDARHVLGFFNEPFSYVEGGSFTSRLLGAIEAADRGNRALPAVPFPGLVAAFRVASEADDGFDMENRRRAVSPSDD